MTNKFLRHNILAALALAVTLPMASCDDIEEADRVIKGTPNSYDRTFETSSIEIDGETFSINDEHKMLIADFTGWKCVNCPTVAEAITKNILPNYPSVLVSLHMTTNWFSMNHRNGYNCASADSIADWIYGSAIASQLPLPSVSIDNVVYNNNILNSNTTDLENLAASRFKECNVDKTAPQANLSVNVKDNGNGSYAISTLVIYPKAKSCNIKLWLIEEGLISTVQSSMNGYIQNYENHGILRQVINGSYEGQDITLNADGQAVVHTNLNISGKDYVAGNCRVVAFITDVNGRTIINSTEAHLTNE